MKQLYFGHPIPMDESLEEELLDHIQQEFPDYRIVNPSDDVHTDNYFEWRDEKEGVTGMDYYFQEVLPDMDTGVFLPFEDSESSKSPSSGSYGAGTAAEIGFLLYKEKDVYEISHDGDIGPLLDVLSVEETKDRIYDRRE